MGNEEGTLMVEDKLAGSTEKEERKSIEKSIKIAQKAHKKAQPEETR